MIYSHTMNDVTSNLITPSEIGGLFHSDEVSLLKEKNIAMEAHIRLLQAELRAVKRELFDPKSERREWLTPEQEALADLVAPVPDPVPDDSANEPQPSKESKRGKASKQRTGNEVNATGLRFDDSVPTREILIEADELKGPDADQYEVVGYKETSRIVQRTSSYEVVITKRQIVKRKDSQQLITAPVMDHVFEGSIADVSFIVGLLVNKFQYYLPLHRQHQMLTAAGITLSRTTLTNLTRQAIELLRPIVVEQLISILESKVLAMDETPIKASRQPGAGKKPGKMKQAYFWPLYGERDEVVFTFSKTRAMLHIQGLLDHVWTGTLLTDGYQAYSSYEAKSESITNAQCWVHMRRQLLKAEAEEEQAVHEALVLIGQLYKNEKHIRDKNLQGEKKLKHRAEHSKSIVDQFFAFCEAQKQRADLLPDDTWVKGLNYTLKRKRQLMVFLENPDVAMDTNHLEREIRPIPMGKNYVHNYIM